ncbi:uncharacterized protein LOC141665932 [Apium graveolens]|uniref:uncharacterized protein LOC141665932 n=1 Tax=Apium graveolens TaxID=4045 RepID=UPI003D7A539D
MKDRSAAENQNSGISPKTPVPGCYGNRAPLSALSMNTLPSKNSAYSPQTHFSPNVPKLKENQISSSKHTRKKCNNHLPSFNHFKEGNKSERKKPMAEFNAMPVKNFNFDDTTPNNTSHKVYDLEDACFCDFQHEDNDASSEDEDFTADLNYDSSEFVKTAHQVVKEYASLVAPDVQCSHCHEWMWKQERLHNDKEKSKRFSDGMRMFNSIFASSSTGGKVDHSINCGGAPDWVKVSDGETVDEIVDGLMKMLDETNELVKEFRSARDRFEADGVEDLEIILKVLRADNGRENHVSTSDEVASIMDGDLDETDGSRDIIIDSKIKGLEKISDIHPKLMALQYPLLFPHGGDGLTPRLGGRLYQQYVVDAFSTIEQAMLWWFRDCDSTNLGKSFILPAGFVGSRRYMQQNFQDALAVCRYIGHPDIFLLMTTNPLSDEIIQMMKHIPLCSSQNSPDMITRVFRLKLDKIAEDIKKKNYFGVCLGVMYVVEFQKRGLPHVHMLIWLDSASKRNLQANVDKYVSAEIPDPVADPVAYAAIKSHMIHGPCGVEFPNSRCMKQHKCIRHFPKKYSPSTTFDQSGFPIYKRRKTNFTVTKGKANMHNQWVIPYNRDLLVKYQCHMNVEICCHARSLKYLFKYCLKGHHRATFQIRGKKRRTDSGEKIDEAEAAYRIFRFNIHYRSVSVLGLSFHFPGKKYCTFRSNEPLAKVAAREKDKLTQLEAYFVLNGKYSNARKYLYDEIPQYYV